MFSKLLVFVLLAMILVALDAQSTAAGVNTTAAPTTVSSSNGTTAPSLNATVPTTTQKSSNGVFAISAILPVFLKLVL